MKQLQPIMFFGLRQSLDAHATDFAEAEIADHACNVTRERVVVNDDKYPMLRGGPEKIRLHRSEESECWCRTRKTWGVMADRGYITKAKVAVRTEVLQRRI